MTRAPFQSIISTIGNTPIIELQNIPKRDVAKCEFLNPGGSIKDRIACQMIEVAEKQGILVPGKSTIIEPTSGNTGQAFEYIIGIGLAMIAAVKGYKIIITMPEKMSMEKCNVLKLLGADVRRTPTNVSFDHPLSHISSLMLLILGLAKKLQSEIPNSVILDQYGNINNPLAHENNTAMEILKDTNNGKDLDYIVIGSGTGGTISGVGKALKKLAPHIKVIGVDPLGSVLAQHSNLPKKTSKPISKDMYLVEGIILALILGIGYDFVPDVLDYSVIDEWISVNDQESFMMARRLVREEGILCGGSSGAATAIAMQLAKRISPEETILVILPDSIRNYMSKFVSDDWMVFNGFLKAPSIDFALPIMNYNWLLISPILVNDTESHKLKQLFKDNSIQPCILVVYEKPTSAHNIPQNMIKGIITFEDGFTSKGIESDAIIRPLEKEMIISGQQTLENIYNLMIKMDKNFLFVTSSNEENKHIIGMITKEKLLKAKLNL